MEAPLGPDAVQRPASLLLRQLLQNHIGELTGVERIQLVDHIAVPLGVRAVQALGGGEDVEVLRRRQLRAVLIDIVPQCVQDLQRGVVLPGVHAGQGAPVHVGQQRQPLLSGLQAVPQGLGVDIRLGVHVVPG